MNLKSFYDGELSAEKIQAKCRQVKNPDLIGTLHHYPSVPSLFINARNVEIWLPPDYDEDNAKGYAVLYMHDGQNLFEAQKAFAGVDWGMDKTITALCEEKQIPPTIVVGIWNTPERLYEYLPQRPFYGTHSTLLRRRVIKRYGAAPISDNYLRFLVYELKPFVDSHYHTHPDRESTFVMGSSMGGLISLYAICEYPQIFAGAGCLSNHWPIGLRAFRTYLKARLPKPQQLKLYLDYGNEANNLTYSIRQKRVEHILKARGYKHGQNLLVKWYPGDHHTEQAWRARVHVPLRFLIKDDQ